MNKTISQTFVKMFRSKVSAISIIHSIFSVLHFKKTTQIRNGISYKEIVKQFFRQYIKFQICQISFSLPSNKRICRPRWLSWMRRPTGDQEVAGSTPAEVGNILSWRLIMKYFLRSFSPFRWFKKGSCQFLAKECAQYWLTAKRTKPAQ